MKISNWIEHLKAACPILVNEVAGSVSLAVAQANTVKRPCAWVISDSENALPNKSTAIHSQQVKQRIGIYVAVKNVATPRDTGYTTEFEAVHAEILAALCGWTPIDAASPVDYVSGKNYGFDPLTQYWYGVFETDYYLRSIPQ